jgi:hypothetical protein
MSDSSPLRDWESTSEAPTSGDRAATWRLSIVVRILHYWNVARGTRTPSSGHSMILLGAVCLALGASCGPIESEPPEARAPYIDPDSVSPVQRLVSVGNGTEGEPVELSALVYDPNREDALNALWTTESDAIGLTRELSRRGTAEINGEEYHEYNPAELEVTPCEIAEAGEKETIWLHVADRSYRTDTPVGDEVSVRSGGHLVTGSWVLSLDTGACEQ